MENRKYGVLSIYSDGKREVIAVGMELLEAEGYAADLERDGQAIGYHTTFQVVSINLAPQCAKCGAMCQACTVTP